MSTSNRRILTAPRMPISVCLTEIPTTPRSCSSLAGSIINKAIALLAKKRPSSFSRSLSRRVSPHGSSQSYLHENVLTFPQKTIAMRKAGTFLEDVTCPSKSTPRHTRPTNKLCTAMDVILHSGARSVFSTTRSTSTEMPWMPTVGPSV